MSETNNAPVAPEAASTEEVVSQEGQEQQEAAPISPKLTRKIKLKLEGTEVDEDLPFDIDENNKEQVEFLKRHLQMSKVSQKRMSEAALTRKQAEQFIQALQNDPMRVLSNPKLMGEEKFQKIAEEFLAKKIQDQMLSPEEKRQREMEEKLRQYEEQDKTAKERAEQEQMQALQQHYQESYTKTITTALESSSLPKNAYTVKRMAQLLQQNIKHGLDIPPEQLAHLVKEDYQKELSSLIGNSDPSQIISMFGEETVNKLRKHDLEKLKSGLIPGVRKETKSFQPQEEPPKTRRWDDFTEQVKKNLK